MSRRWRWGLGGLRAGLLGLVALGAGCDGERDAVVDGGLVDRGDAGCEAVGQTWQLPPSPVRSLAGGPDGFVLLLGEYSFTPEWMTFTVGSGAPVQFADGVGGQIGAFAGEYPPALAGNGDAVIGFGTGPALERIQIRRWDGMAWTAAAEDIVEPLADGPIQPRAASAAISSSGEIAIAWTASDPADEDGPPTLWLARQTPDGGFLPREAVFTPADDVRRGPCHVAVDASGGVHVLGARQGEMGVELIYRHRDPGGEWGALVPVGPAAPATAEGLLSGLAVTSSGEAFAAEIHGASIFTDEDGAAVVYRIEGGAARQVAEITDPRSDLAGLAMGPVGDEIAIATAYAGDLVVAADGPGSVELFVCNADGCRFGGRAASVPGIHYGPVALATRGRKVMLAWDELSHPVFQDTDGTRVSRFECP